MRDVEGRAAVFFIALVLVTHAAEIAAADDVSDALQTSAARHARGPFPHPLRPVRTLKEPLRKKE